jgi:HSP20 family protein
MFGLTPYNKNQNSILRNEGGWDLRSVFNDFFSDSFLPTAFFSLGQSIRADIKENEKEYIVEAEVPGVHKEDIKVDLRDDVLTVSVEQNELVKEEKENYLRKERRYGSYSRSFYVEDVKNETVSAKYSDGILKIILPKDKSGRQEKHTIDIQ